MKELDGFEEYANRPILDVLPSVQLEYGKLCMRDEVTHEELDIMYLNISQHNDQRLNMIAICYNWHGRHYRTKPTREINDELDEEDDESGNRDKSEREHESKDEGDDDSDDDDIGDEAHDVATNLLALAILKDTDSSSTATDPNPDDLDWDWDYAESSTLAGEVEQLLAESPATYRRHGGFCSCF